jgi:hypothetical protein
MQSIFDRLSNIGLRRLFKFAVKRAIGRYLENELLIDQLTIQSRDGVISLSQLSLNCALLNSEYLTSLPVKLVEVSIASLEAKLSYSSLLSEGFQFVVRGLNIVLEPGEINVQAPPISRAASRSGSSVANRGDEALSDNTDAEDGMAFIANWLEVLVSGLRVTVEDIYIVFRTNRKVQSVAERRNRKSTQSHSHRHSPHEVGLTIRVSSIVYNNSVLSGQNTDTSVTLTEKLAHESLPVDSVSSKKVAVLFNHWDHSRYYHRYCFVQSLRISAATATVYKEAVSASVSSSSASLSKSATNYSRFEEDQLFTLEPGSLLMIDAATNNVGVTLILLDADVSSIQVKLDNSALTKIMALSSSISSVSVPTAMVENRSLFDRHKEETLKWLEGLVDGETDDKDMEINYGKIIEHLKKVLIIELIL